MVDSDEDCDQGALNGSTCVSEGFGGGVLSCGSGCVFDTSACYAARFVDNADGTISDEETALMWEKKVKGDAAVDGANPHDSDNPYPWSGTCSIGGSACQPNAAAEAACLAGVQGQTYGCAQCGSGVCNVAGGVGITVWQWLGALNTAAFGGYSDWRLPRKSELSTLVDEGQVTWTSPVIGVAFRSPICPSCTDVTSPACSCTRGNYYWSASTYEPYGLFSWVVDFYGGYVYALDKTSNLYVRAVRGGS